MLIGIDQISPYERQLLLVLKQAMERSPQIDENKKRRIEGLIQDIVDVWVNEKR